MVQLGDQLVKQRMKVYEKLYKANGALNALAYDDCIKDGGEYETQPFKSHPLVERICNVMEMVMRGDADPSDGLAILRHEDVKPELYRAREMGLY